MAKGKWAQGIVPRHFAWIIKDRLAVCERPGGYGENHRRVRRQEEIIWIREQGFGKVISLLASPHNLHHYDELDVSYVHLPFPELSDADEVLPELYRQLDALAAAGEKVILHHEELGDRVSGAVTGYLIHTGLVPEEHRAVAIVERLLERHLTHNARRLVAIAARQSKRS
ncbi:MAG TPA: hypothetical protein VGA13_12375 [Acidimicrobiales bacterium]|jgi:hypothetical protein